MKEKPILFNTDMVRAILDGRKTQTRRIYAARNSQVWPRENDLPGLAQAARQCKFGKPGDRLWVRETWMHSNWPERPVEPDCAIFYRADYLDDPLGPDLEHSSDGIRRKWLPSIHMPRWASRILLEVTAVRVERLQDISEADAQAEGATGQCPVGNLRIYNEAPLAYHFAQIWEQAHPNTWDQNPWVWVIDFQRIEP